MVGSGGYSLDRPPSSSNADQVVVETDGKYKRTPQAAAETNGAPLQFSNDKMKQNGTTTNGTTAAYGKVAPLNESSTEASSTDEGSSSNDDKKKKPMVGIVELFRFSNSRDRFLMFIGTVVAIAQGAAMPVMMMIFGQMSDLFIDTGKCSNVVEIIADNITGSCATSAAQCTNTNLNCGVPCDWCYNATASSINEAPNEAIMWLNCFNMTSMANELEKVIPDCQTSLQSQMNKFALYYVYIACGVMVIAYIQLATWHIAAYNQSERIRARLLQSILHQEIGWFDLQDAGEFSTRLVDDVNQIEKGIGDKLSMLFQNLAQFVAGFVVGFTNGWKLTLVILSVSPLLAVAGGVSGKLLSLMTKKELDAYAKAGAIAEEVIGAIRTVVAFGGQEKEATRYSKNLVHAMEVGVRKGFINGLGFGATIFVLYGSYALAFWYGSSLVRSEEYTAGQLITVFFSVLVGAFSIGMASPHIEDFSNARGAAYTVYNIIDHVSSIDSSADVGIKPEKLIGNIEFRDVHFNYPSREDVKILQGLNLKINVSQTVALVGSSGCGKSTCVQLLQRFYDPQGGQVLIDGVDIKDYNIKWLRRNIGVVSQEPILFGTTIAENIRYGREGTTQEEVEKAAKQANAHDFICQLPKKYETLVGERGAQLSGGQKQRIAIARALVRNPKILLLDEATSALDTESEGIVQSALDKARQGRTTLVIAHRLSTIQTADIIAGVVAGVVVEQGTHQELMQKGGVYHTLVTNQQNMSKMVDEDSDDESDRLDQEKGEKTSLHRVPSAREKYQRARSVSVISNKSRSSTVVKDKKEEEEKLPDPPITRIMKMNAPEWWLITIGVIAAVISGCIQPAYSLIFSSILGVFSEPDLAIQEERCNFYSGMFAVLGAIGLISIFTRSVTLNKSGELLTMRLREQTFRSLLRMEIAYFDDHKNSVGALCSRLATDASAVRGATGTRLSVLLQSFGSIAFGVTIGFVYSWKLTLVVLGFAPLVLITGILKMRIVTGSQGEINKKMEEASKFAVEAIENIRTVSTLTLEDKVLADFKESIAGPYKTHRRKGHIDGLAFGFSQSLMFFANAACFSFGAFLVENDGLLYENMFKVFTGVLFGAMAAGQASSLAPDYGKAKFAAARLFALFDRVPPIDSSSEEGIKLTEISGSVELRDVQFTYPTRPDIQVLKGLSVTVKPGQMVALVGSSGCGKSTVVQLIERFYDPSAGKVSVDGHPVDTLHLQSLRRQLGIVSQEPILFDCSIRENIAYGDNFREVTMEEIIEAARKANIHNFIQSLPQGYETNVGDKGTQLSGGQKQRVAIARALIRSPKILLLDEATSALDTESEKVVQEALERAQEGRTSIVIAHRLSTIQNADCIIVIHSGRVAEVGTHSELLAKRGIYYKLNIRQTNTDKR